MSAATHHRAMAYRGDTLLGFSVAIAIDGQPASVSSARLHLRTPAGALVHDWPATCAGNLVSLPDVPAATTAKWPTGTLDYDLEVTLADGRTVTWLTGTQPIAIDRTR